MKQGKTHTCNMTFICFSTFVNFQSIKYKFLQNWEANNFLSMNFKGQWVVNPLLFYWAWATTFSSAEDDALACLVFIYAHTCVLI